MKKHLRKKETNCRSCKASSNGKRRSGQGIGFEQLEDRTVPALIEWSNRADFDNEFGVNTAAARALINQALLDWERSLNHSTTATSDKTAGRPAITTRSISKCTIWVEMFLPMLKPRILMMMASHIRDS